MNQILHMLRFGLVFSLLIPSLIFAQEPANNTQEINVERLDSVVITATRTLRHLSSVPMPTLIISNYEIEGINSVRLNDILNEQNGLITVADFGGGEGVQLQGLDSQYVLVLIDGMPLVGRSAGTLDLNRIAVKNIRQIEVVKGASSSLYGNEALGGVINIITEEPKDGFNGEVSHRTGSFETNDTSFDLNFKKNRWTASTFLNRNSSEGYNLIDNNPLNTVAAYSNYTLNTKLSFNPNSKLKLKLSGRYFTQEQDNRVNENIAGESDIREWNSTFQVNYSLKKNWDLDFDFYITNYTADEFLATGTGDLISQSDFDQSFIRPEFRSTIEFDEGKILSAGVGMNRDELKRTDFFTNPVFYSPYGFVQYDTDFGDKLNLIAGLRYDSHNEYNSQLSPKLALKYDLNSRISLKGSLGYGFKAPDFRQLYFNFTNSIAGYSLIGYNAVPDLLPQLEEQGQISSLLVPLSEFNGRLSPENSVGINLGTTFRANGTLNMELNLFHNSIRELIDTRAIAIKTNGQNVFSYFNVDEVITRGMEFSFNWRPINALRLSGGYQLLYAKDQDAKDAFGSGEVFARPTPGSALIQLDESDYFGLFNRSRHMANLKLFYRFDKWKADANLRLTYRSKFGLFDSNNNTYLDKYDTFVDAYSILDFAFNKRILSNYRIGLGVDNLLDFTDPQNISNIPGRILYGTININF